MISLIFTLLVCFQLKHFLADYPLQGDWMLGKSRSDWSFFAPLFAHAFVHALFTFIIVVAAFLFNGIQNDPLALGLAGLDLVIHFTMDRIKASPKLLGRFKALTPGEYIAAKWGREHNEESAYTVDFYQKQLRGNKLFWWSLGFDQMVHHLTDYLVIYYTVTCIVAGR